MNRVTKLFLLLLIGLSAAQTVDPTDYLVPPTQDLSISFLTDMFGGVGSVLLGPQTIAGMLFEIFNLGILVVAMYLLAYTISFNLINDMGSGQPIAHQYDIWTISRVIVGNSFLLPSYSGYSLIQIMVMQVAIYGVGLADSVWTTAINNISVFGSPTSPPLTQNETEYVNSILGDGTKSATSAAAAGQSATVDILWEMSVCAEAQFQHDTILNKASSRQDYTWRIKDNTAYIGKTINGKSCGSVSLNINGLTDDQALAAQNSFYNTVITLQGYAQSIFDNALKRDPTLFYDVLICPPDGPPSNCQQGPEIAQIASLYYGSLKPFALSTSDSSDTDDSIVSSDVLEKGWAAGSFYIASLIDSEDSDLSSDSSSVPTVDEAKLMSMLYKVSTLVTYKSNSDDIYNDASQIYWILSQCTGLDACGEPPYGLTDSATISSVWEITKSTYIKPASAIIDDAYMPSSSSTTYCSGNRYLDVASATLYMNWLKWDKNDGVFKDMDLDALSILFKNDASGGFDDVYVGFNQRNLYVLLNKIMSDITGVRYFSDMNKSDYDSATHNSAIDDVSGKCDDKSDVTGCFCAMAANANLVTPGRGLMGGFAGNVTSSGQFLTVNPISLLRHMGLDIFKHSIDTMVQSIFDALNTTRQLATEYFNVMLTLQIPFTAFGFTLSVFEQEEASNLFNSFTNLVNSFYTVFQFLQLLDFQEMELYRGILNTFTSITPMIGFTLGIYLPLIPSFYYLFAVMGWFIAVIEAMIAAPIIALGITYPKGHDLLGNSEQGIILLMQLFIRPVSIVFGLMAGILLSSILFQLFNYMMIGFLAGYASSFSDFGTDKTSSLIGVALIVLSYAYIAIVIVSNSFTLIYRLPERVLRWIGAPIDPVGVGEMVNEVRRGASDAMSKGLRSGAQTRGDMTSVESSRFNLGTSPMPDKLAGKKKPNE